MNAQLPKRAVFFVMALAMIGLLTAPAGADPAGKNRQVRGVATFGTERCPEGLDLQPQADGWGLDGCLNLMTVDESRLSNGGVYNEYGTEQFVGDLVKSGEIMSTGTFDTEYLITSKWAGEPFASEQFHGRCQHPITTGTGDFDGATGRIDFKDTIVDGVAVEFPFFGHVKLAS